MGTEGWRERGNRDFEDHLRDAEQDLDSDAEGRSRDYSPDELFPARVVGSDGHGHSETLAARVHPRLAALIDRIVERKVFPLKNRSHAVTCAILHFIETLRGLDPTVSGIMGQIGGIAGLIDSAEMARQYDIQLNRACDEVQYLVSKGMDSAAGKLAGRFIAEVQAMPDGDWKRVWQRDSVPRLEKILAGKAEGDAQ